MLKLLHPSLVIPSNTTPARTERGGSQVSEGDRNGGRGEEEGPASHLGDTLQKTVHVVHLRVKTVSKQRQTASNSFKIKER